VIEWFIASGSDLGDIENQKGKRYDYLSFTALEIAREKNHTEVVSVLERFLANPALTRFEIRANLGVLDELAAEVFALVVFLCDELLQFKSASHPATAPDHAAASATRFFVISSKLPMELQMILCHRAVGTMQNIILKLPSNLLPGF